MGSLKTGQSPKGDTTYKAECFRADLTCFFSQANSYIVPQP